MHNLEQKNVDGVMVTSFAENGSKERAWHGLGQVFDRPMYVREALEACHANYEVKLTPVVALSDDLLTAIQENRFISAAALKELMVDKAMATVRTDTNQSLGIVSDKYGVVDNLRAFQFVDMFCSGKDENRDNTPVIESCGVLGRGERVFVTAKFPQPIYLDNRKDDALEVFVVFTTSHDGSGAVKCMCTPVRVVCQNTLSWAIQNNYGRISFRHSLNVNQKLDLLKEENAEFAYKALNLANVYSNLLVADYEQLRKAKLTEKNVDAIVAELTLNEESKKIFLETGNINHSDIPQRGRTIFIDMKNAIESGIGQDIITSGTGEWLMNGVTTFYQNNAKFRNNETKFDSIMDGMVYKKVNTARKMVDLLAA